MQHECRITVLETKVFPKPQEKYLAEPKSEPCSCFKVGDTFLLKRTPQQDDFYRLMNGKFCGEAGYNISRERFISNNIPASKMIIRCKNQDKEGYLQ